MVKCLAQGHKCHAQGHKCHDWDSNPHSVDLTLELESGALKRSAMTFHLVVVWRSDNCCSVEDGITVVDI